MDKITRETLNPYAERRLSKKEEDVCLSRESFEERAQKCLEEAREMIKKDSVGKDSTGLVEEIRNTTKKPTWLREFLSKHGPSGAEGQPPTLKRNLRSYFQHMKKRYGQSEELIAAIYNLLNDNT